jgi:hypothetical protein
VNRFTVAPQAKQRCLAGGEPEHRQPPQLLVYVHAWPRAMALHGLAVLLQCRNEPHRQIL